MSEIATIILPFLGLIALGFGAVRVMDLPAQGVSGLNLFVYYIALPAWFFQLVAITPFDDLAHWSFVVTTTFATYCAFAIAFSFGALMNRGNVPEATIQGLAGSYANSGYMAPALAIAAFGPAAAAPTALIFSFDSAMLFALVPLMMMLGGTTRTNGTSVAREIGRRIFLHPFILATLLGLLVSVSGLGLPAPVDGFLSLLRGAAAPVALFAVGAGLAQLKLGKIGFQVPVLLVVKLIVHPLIVYLLLGWIGGFDAVWVYTATLLAALPSSANLVAIARQFGTYEDQARAAVFYGTAVSVVTLTAVVALLVTGALPAEPFR